MEELNIENKSGDHKYFTLVPNIVLNHSTAIDQALYLQMKRVAGDEGECFYSEVTLRKRLGIGKESLKKSLKYLLDHKWIAETGFKEVMTKGGVQKVRVYRVNDIWKSNIAEYDKGCPETAPLGAKGVLKQHTGCPETETNKNPVLRTNTTVANAPEITIEDENARPKKESHAKYPHSKEVFGLWGKYPANWNRNTTQLVAAENLYAERGLEEIKLALSWYADLKDKEFCPSITTPYDLDSKWGKFELFVNKKQ